MNLPIRVLHITTKLSFGGVQSFLMNYYKSIDKEIIQFDFVVQSTEEGIYEDYVRKMGGRIYKLPSINKDRQEFEKCFYTLLKDHPEYKVVHAHQNFLNIIPLKVAKKAGVPVRISHSHSLYASNSIFKSLLHFAFKLAIPFYATYYFACSSNSARWMYGKINESSRKCHIIHNAIDTNKFKFDPIIRRKIRKELELEDKFVVIHVGMFGEAKNHEFLINIFNELHRMDRNSVLLLIGDGEKMSEIKTLASDLNLNEQIFFLGLKNDVNEYLMAADILLFPSKNEGLPVTVIEAQASGLPCLVSEAVPREIDITGLVKWCSLKKSAKGWANLIDQQTNRMNTYKAILDGNYDIVKETEKLTKLYKEGINR